MSTDAGFLSVAVAVAFDDEFVGGGLEPVDSGLREERVGHQRDPLDWLTIRGDDRGFVAVSFDDKFVDVAGVVAVEAGEREVVQDEQVDAEEFADFGVVAVVESRDA